MAHNPDHRTRTLVQQSSSIIQSTATDPREDARAERQRSSFNVDELTAFMAGGIHKLKRRSELLTLLTSQAWADKTCRYFLTRNEEYVGGLQASVGLWRLMRQHNLSLDDAIECRNLLFFPGGLELHIGMFIPSILSQGSPEQQAKWLPLCNSLKVIGTYAQTELGHGTFVRGLETLAVYDKDTRQFIVHSPNLTSTKWWPGGLGKTATHVILMARLILPDSNSSSSHGSRQKDYGPHGFVVQIRDMGTHLPLPGITVGDIGPKMGYNGVDNGYLRFNHVRIPKDAMLSRFSSITDEGAYIPPPKDNAKASYATMVYVRATIVRDAGEYLGRAVTIATRYTAVRRQTAPGPNERELQVLDYDGVQQTLLPLIAKTYALKFMGNAMMDMYDNFNKDRDAGNFNALPELHALSSGLKSLCTDIAAGGIEASRRTCGGHGYSMLSGLPTLFNSYVQNVTWEGDNNVMFLQTARYLLKAFLAVNQSAAGRKPIQGSASYLEEAITENRSLLPQQQKNMTSNSKCTVTSPEGWRRPQVQLDALKAVAIELAFQAAETLKRHHPHGSHLVFEGAPWNNSTVDLIKLAKAHCVYAMHQAMVARVAAMQHTTTTTLSPSCLAVMHRLTALHGIVCCNEAAADLLESGHVSPQQVAALRIEQRAVVREIRPDAVALVDAFGYEDYLLHSALGRKAGDVYNSLFSMAQGSPLNETEEGPAWQPVLKQLLSTRSRL